MSVRGFMDCILLHFMVIFYVQGAPDVKVPPEMNDTVPS